MISLATALRHAAYCVRTYMMRRGRGMYTGRMPIWKFSVLPRVAHRGSARQPGGYLGREGWEEMLDATQQPGGERRLLGTLAAQHSPQLALPCWLRQAVPR